jgi:hypothetical protein
MRNPAATAAVTAASDSGFEREWDRAHAEVRARVNGVLRDLGMSERALAYVAELRLYQRAPFLVTQWVRDPSLRSEMTEAVALHLIGIKLVDDLLDGDTDFDRWDLGLGVQLIQGATRALASHAHAHRVLAVLEEDYRRIWQGQLREKREPAETFEEWHRAAELNAARCLGCYAEAATLAGGDPAAVEAARAFARAFAFLVRIADDALDYARGERHGNLVHLLEGGALDVADVHALVEQMRSEGRRAAAMHAPAYDVAPVVDRYADDVLHRILPA